MQLIQQWGYPCGLAEDGLVLAQGPNGLYADKNKGYLL
jgi:hypothetical protein